MTTMVIIGGGMIGCFLAHDLAAYEGVQVTLLEKNAALCDEISAANSAIIHAGYDPEEGTLKGLLNKRGADLYPALCARLGVAYRACGAFVLASDEEEVAILQELAERGKKRGVRMRLMNREELLAQEPHIQESICAGLDVPDTAVVTPWEIGIALMREAVCNGADVRLQQEVTAIQKQAQGYLVCTSSQQYQADIIINAAGLGAQQIMNLVEDTPLFTVTPKRGQYVILSKHAASYATHVLYPVPTAKGKGVLCVPTVHGNLLIGPNSEVSEQDTATTAAGLAEVKQRIKKTMKDVPFQEVIHSYSGIRPCGNHNDFFIKASSKDAHIIHLGCIDSPGLASAPAISEYVIQTLISPLIKLQQKAELRLWPHPIAIKQLDEQQRAELIQQQPGYGHIICRCEQISEQEVVDCIHQLLGARTIKEIKKQLRPGMGKCQGGYCEIEVAKLLARELHIPLSQVLYDKTAYYEESKGCHHEED